MAGIDMGGTGGAARAERHGRSGTGGAARAERHGRSGTGGAERPLALAITGTGAGGGSVEVFAMTKALPAHGTAEAAPSRLAARAGTEPPPHLTPVA